MVTRRGRHGEPEAPARAATCCTTEGQRYFCDYGVTTTKFPDGTKREFVVGADHAVWTNWTRTDGSWTDWQVSCVVNPNGPGCP
ncbi:MULTISPECIES: hypothetical protein [unclassified Streptomyces]|uniref:hypothetical protein n=1 Tax=unclassified Streptomyces TaxID=2593676 RepID=UPI0006AF595E|nr:MULTISPECIES: hypothetical protein [unclassified Streptomyces]